MNTYSAPASRRRSDRSRARDRAPLGLPPSRSVRDESAGSRGGLLSTAFLSGLFGLAVSAGLGLVLILAAAAAAYANADPDALIGPLGLAAVALSSLCGGFAAARHGRRAPLVCGLFSAFLMVLFLLTGNIFFGDETRAALTLGLAPEVKAGLYAVAAILEVVGALLGRRRRY